MKYLISIVILSFLLSSGCERAFIDRKPADNPIAIFDTMWHTIDRKYSYFDLKGIDWNEVYDTTRPIVNEETSIRELYEVLADMLFELRDGHVNLVTPFNISRNWQWYLESPENFDYSIIERNYLGENYEITGPFRNSWLKDTIGYFYYGSFSSNVSDFSIDYIVNKYMQAKGIIIDVRNNGGGSTSNADKIASRFTDKERLFGYERYKTGPAHDEFSGYHERFIQPKGDTQYTKKIVILTNRKSYSATNDFVLQMKALPYVTVVGDTSGGGAGVPHYAQLQNGWTYRFSSTQTVDPLRNQVEQGIPPDVVQNLTASSKLSGRDDIIERAIQIIRQ